MSTINFNTADSELYSVYIPIIHNSFTDFSVTTFFERNQVGRVERVDFTPFKSDEHKGYRQAFVHFSPLRKTNAVLKEIEQEGSCRFYPYRQYSNALNSDISEKQQNEYWILLKNNAPVPKTELNIHQLAHNQKLMEERSAQMEEREAQMVQKMEQMTQKMEKMEENMGLIMQINEKFANTIEVQSTHIQILSERLSKISQSETQVKPDMESIEKKISELTDEVDLQYWRLINKNETLALDVSHLYERLWLDVEKLLKKTDKNVTDIADCNHSVWELTQNFKRADEKVNRVIDVVQSVVEQVADKTTTDYKTKFMKFGETHSDKGKMTIDELL